MNLPIFSALGSVLLTSSVAGGLFFFSSFESRAYKAGEPLAGQAGWVSLASPKAAEIVQDRSKARCGRRAIEVWGGGDLESFSLPYYDLLDAAYEQVVEFDEGETPRRVRVSADVRLDGPDTGVGPNDDLASANLYARNGADRSAWIYLSSNGNAYCFANSELGGSVGYAFETPIKQGKYNRLAIILDYRTHLAEFRINGKSVGELPFGGSGEKFTGALIEFAAIDDLNYIDPKLYRAYWDNILVLGRAEGCR